MAKAPIMGRVKTRLGRDIGAVSATNFYRHAMARVVVKLARDRRWQTILAVAPDTAVHSAKFPAGVRQIPQGSGDLGQRMQRIMDRLPPGPVAIVGTDIPRLEPRHVAAAFKFLGRSDAVFGPAGDGGYWLVGFKRRPRVPEPFTAVRWSTEHAMVDSVAALGRARCLFADTLDDVDDRAAFVSTRAFSGRLVRAP